MSQFTNMENLPLSIAVFLANETYDKSDEAISATQLLKPTRQLILDARLGEEQKTSDIMGLVASRIGTAIHDGIERAWLNYEPALRALGYPEKTIAKFRINPDEAEAAVPGIIPVYMEQRWERETKDGYFVSGKCDLVLQGELTDYKSCSTYSYNDEEAHQKYIGQGSIYRWIRPDLITSDYMTIIQIFTDWSSGKAKQDSNYPQSRIVPVRLPLWSLSTTERFINHKISDLVSLMDADESQLPECNDKELWRRPTVWKYYKDPEKRTRSTKNYEFFKDAEKHLNQDGNVGIIVEDKGKAVACRFCSAFPICSQAQRLASAGEIQF